MSLQKESDKRIIRLHNDFVEAIYSLSVDAKKLLLSVILHMNDSNKIVVHRKEVVDEVGIDLKNLNPKHREDIIEELMTKIITIRDLNKKENWKKYQLLMATEYENGVLTTSVYPQLLPYFKEAQQRLFTRFNIQNIKPLTSIHAIRIYELCKQYDDTGWREIDLEDFKKMLKIENKYKLVSDLKKRVLEVAKKQINKNTDINIDYELIKQGRKYTKLKLYISKNRKRVERNENKKLIKNGKLDELERALNEKYKKQGVKGKDGLTWFINSIKVLNEKEAEITLTDLTNERVVRTDIDKIDETLSSLVI